MKEVALITGASKGIGRELALIHASNGRDLVIVARDKKKLNELKLELEKDFSVKVRVIVKDLSLPGSSKEVYDELKKSKIKLDYLVNNAGFGGIGKFSERDWDKDYSMINLNIVALTELTRLFLPDFIKRDKGRILNVSSTASLLPGPFQAVYYATKAYVTSFSNAVFEELHDSNVTVTALLPGATKTEFGKVSGMDKTEMFKHPANAKNVALDGYNGMMSGELNVISGLTFPQKVLMGMVSFLPRRFVLKQIRKMQDV